MKTLSSNRPRNSGFTLVELLVGMAISLVGLSGLSVGSIALQRSFEAANYQMNAQNDQLRVLDYLSRDFHLASKVTRADDGAKITVSLPVRSTGTPSLNLGPLLGSVTGTATTQTVSYYVEGGEFIREVNGGQSVLADTVDSVQFDTDGAYVTTSVVFTPRFSYSPTMVTQPLTRAQSRVYLRNATQVN